MAAKVNFQAVACHGLCIFFNLLIVTILVQETYAATTEADTTEAATTISTAALTTTTTLPPPTEAPSPIAINTDIGPCICDLTGNACDVNCCCDTDCSEADKLAFSECLSFSVTIDDRLCIQSDLLLINNTPSFTARTQDGLFCIYYDNNKKRNYYTNPDLVDDDAMFQKYVDKFAGPTYRPDPVVNVTYFDKYRSGDPVYVVYENLALGYLGLPDTVGSTFCSDNNPAAFLSDQSTTCVRPLNTLTQDGCANSLFWTASTYYQGFKIVATPHLFNWIVNLTEVTVTTAATPVVTTDSNMTTATVPTVTTEVTNTTTTVVATTEGVTATEAPFAVDLYNNTYSLEVTMDKVTCQDVNGAVINCPANSPLAPAYDAASSVCNNVVLGVEYILAFGTGTPGIMAFEQLLLTTAKVRLTLGSISSSSLPLSQTFSVNFQAPNEVNVTEKSGNPGYIIGKPVRAGIRVVSTNSAIVEGKNILTLVKSSATGTCLTDAANRVPVNFRENMRTGCLIRFDLASLNVTDYCSTMRDAVIDALEGLADTNNRDNIANRFVAIFGNSDVLQTGDWVRILRNEPPEAVASQSTLDGPSCRLSMGMHIQILYAKIGALANPQAKIVGVSFVYENAQQVTYKCVGSYCRTGSNGLVQSFEIRQSVNFIDVSQDASGIAGEAPIFLAKVPYDFFYPFVRDSGHSMRYNTQLIVSLIVLVNFVMFVMS